MKKLLTILLIVTLVISATACTKKQKDNTTSDKTAVSGTETKTEEKAIKTEETNDCELEEITDPVKTDKPADNKAEAENKAPQTPPVEETKGKDSPSEKSDDTPYHETTPIFPGSKDAPIEMEEIPDR